LTNLLPNRAQDRTRYNLRNKNNLDIPFCRVNCHTFSFLPTTLQDWNNLDIKIQESPSINAFKSALRKKKEKPPPLYYQGNRRTSVMQCRMRLGCSPLRNDLCKELKVIPNSLCACGEGDETAQYFFYDCSLHAAHRLIMMEELYKIDKFNLATLLYGDKDYDMPKNKRFFEAVHKFIEDTNRFN
jgi:hypothetical protein